MNHSACHTVPYLTRAIPPIFIYLGPLHLVAELTIMLRVLSAVREFTRSLIYWRIPYAETCRGLGRDTSGCRSPI